MSTAVILIGNSDDKLTQTEWSDYVTDVTELLMSGNTRVHFLGYAPSNAPWQNACWVIEVPPGQWLLSTKSVLRKLAAKYRQDSIALVVGETEFVEPREFPLGG